MHNEFAKWEIKTSVFSGRKPQAGNCCCPISIIPTTIPTRKWSAGTFVGYSMPPLASFQRNWPGGQDRRSGCPAGCGSTTGHHLHRLPRNLPALDRAGRSSRPVVVARAGPSCLHVVKQTGGRENQAGPRTAGMAWGCSEKSRQIGSLLASEEFHKLQLFQDVWATIRASASGSRLLPR